MEYLLQETGSNCWLYALCNTLIYFGKHPPLPGTPMWEWLMDVGMCRHGTCIGSRAIALQLGLNVDQFIFGENPDLPIPSLLTVSNHDGVGGMHICLVEARDDEKLTLVNYRWGEGPVVETLKWDDIPMPKVGNVNRRAYVVTFTGLEPPEITMCPFCRSWWYPNAKKDDRGPWHHTTCPRYEGS